MQIDELNDLISDGRVLACEHVLRQVVSHLENRGFSLFEIVTATAGIVGKRGFLQAEVFVEDGANSIPNAYTKEINDDLTDII